MLYQVWHELSPCLGRCGTLGWTRCCKIWAEVAAGERPVRPNQLSKMEIVEKVRRCLVLELATDYRLKNRFPVLAIRLGLQPYEKNCKFSNLICVEKVVSTGTFSLIIGGFHTT